MASDSPALAGITPYLLYLIAICVTGPMQFGFHLAELNTPSDVIRCLTTNFIKGSGIPECIPMDEAAYGAVSSIFTLGGLLGALAAGPYSSRKGRVQPMRLAAPFFVIGSIVETFALNAGMLGVGRFLSGIGAGISVVVVPIYISEVAPSNARGALGASTQVATNVGILIAQVLGYFMSRSDLWRYILIVGAGIGAVQGFGMAGVIESPLWLASKGRARDAARNAVKIQGSDAAVTDTLLRAEGGGGDTEREGLLGDQGEGINATAESKDVGFFEISRHPDHWRAVVALVAIMVAQQFSGINAVMMYSVSFLKGIMPNGAGLITVVIGLLNIVVTASCAPLADKLGRKTCLLASIAGMAVNALLIGVGLANDIQLLCAVCTLLFVAAFAVGLGPVPFILASELVGPEAVGAAQSWSLGANWVATFVVAQFFPILNGALAKGYVFYLFAVLGLIAFLFVSWWVPETKGKADADEVWGRSSRNEHVD